LRECCRDCGVNTERALTEVSTHGTNRLGELNFKRDKTALGTQQHKACPRFISQRLTCVSVCYPTRVVLREGGQNILDKGSKSPVQVDLG
jgi:hypothetical protein